MDALALDLAGHYKAHGGHEITRAVLTWHDATGFGDVDVTTEVARMATEIRLAYLASVGAK
jgi:hypothetical protein